MLQNNFKKFHEQILIILVLYETYVLLYLSRNQHTFRNYI